MFISNINSSCQCTEIRVVSNHRRFCKVQDLRIYERRASAPVGTSTSTSNETDSSNYDNEFSTEINYQILQEKLPEMNRLKAEINDKYCYHLQKITTLSKQSRSNEQFVPSVDNDESTKI